MIAAIADQGDGGKVHPADLGDSRANAEADVVDLEDERLVKEY